MSRSILDDNYDHGKNLIAWLEASIANANEWRESGQDGKDRRIEAWERISQIAIQLHNHAKHAADAEDIEP